MKSHILYFINLIKIFIPETRGFGIKNSLYRLAGVKIDKNTKICSSVKILGSGELIIGKNVWIGPDTMILCSEKIIIEDNVDIAPRVYVGTGTHNIGDKKGRVAGTGKSLPITIKKGCWIGSNVIIMPGVTINKMSMVNSGAVVTKDTCEYSLVAGIPAKLIKNIKSIVHGE